MSNCNMCGETTNPIDTEPSFGGNDQYGLINAKVEGGYLSPALQDCSTYTFTFCEYCLNHIFKQCLNPPQSFDYYHEQYKPIEDVIKEEEFVRGEVQEYHKKILQETHRRDKLRPSCSTYVKPSLQMLEFKKIKRNLWQNRVFPPTKEYQTYQKEIVKEVVKAFYLLSKEEQETYVAQRDSYSWDEKNLPTENWWNSSISKDEDIVSQQVRDDFNKFGDLMDVFIDCFDPNYEALKKELDDKVEQAYQNADPTSKPEMYKLYKIHFNIRS